MAELNREFLVNKFGSENQLQELTQIEVSYNRTIKRINSNAFKGLVNIETISVQRTGLEEIEDELFEDLPNLKYLNLSYNKLNKIDSNAFERLENLERLELDRNELTVINVKLFASLSNLKVLLLDKNKLKTIEPNTFNGLHKLERLTLDNTELEEIDVRLFESLSSLKELTLDNNKLNRIDSNSFENLAKLEILRLNNNEIEVLDEKAFENLINLKVIDLNNNKLRRIHSNTFKNLAKLEILRLHHNEIEELNHAIFDGLSNLKDLYLNNNKLKWIDRKCFKSLKSMEIIQIYENDFKAVSFFIPTKKLSYVYDPCYRFKVNFKKYGYISDWHIFLEQFDESNEFYNPKLLIVDYYDSIISQIDIYTEELLEKYNEDDLLKKNRKKKYSFEDDRIKNPYKIEYKNESVINFNPGSTKIIDYLNLVRSKAIEEINKAKEENLERYEINKDKYKYDRNNLTVEKVQEMKRELFKEKFCFFIKSDDNFYNTNIFKFHTIVTDFYLDHFDRLLLVTSNFLENISISFYLDNLCLLLTSNYITGLSKSHDNEVISIRKESLKKIEHINVVGSNYCGKIDCNFKLSHGFQDLSQIKSIDVVYDKIDEENKIINLKSLTNLEYLSISDGKNSLSLKNYLDESILETVLYPGVFDGLSSLKMLELNSMDIKYLDPEVFIHTPMLTHLKIDLIKCKLKKKTFSHLKHLKTIAIAKSNLDHIDWNLLEDLRKLNIKIIFFS